MVSPKKKEYSLTEEKGQRRNILVMLLKGKENKSSITRALGYKNKKSSAVSKYIQKLEEKGFLDEDRIFKKTKDGKTIFAQGHKLNSKIVFEAAKNFDVSFNKSEMSKINKMFNSFNYKDRVNMATASMFENVNGVLKSIIFFIFREMNKKEDKDFIKYISTIKKLIIVSQPNLESTPLNKLISEIECRVLKLLSEKSKAHFLKWLEENYRLPENEEEKIDSFCKALERNNSFIGEREAFS